MTSLDLTEQSQELCRLLIRASGYLDANFVHAFTAAFHRLPRLHEQLGADFARSQEVREVAAALLELLLAREREGSDGGSREGKLARQIQATLQAIDQIGTDRDAR